MLTLEPSTTWNKEGLEFCLTAFENPGVSLPTSITTWVAMRGMPEFMEHLRNAVFSLREWMAEQKVTRDDASNLGSLVAMVSMPMPHDEADDGGVQDYMEPPLQRQFQDPSEIAGSKVTKPADTKATSAPAPTQRPPQQQQQQQDSSESRKYVYVNISL